MPSRPACDPLEPRRLLAGTISVANGVITVTGTNSRDNVHVEIVPDDTASALAVTINGASRIFSDHELSSLKLKQLVVNALGGDDQVTVDDTYEFEPFPPPDFLVNLGDGNDHLSERFIRTAATGGAGNDTVDLDEAACAFDGGSGTDTIHGNNLDPEGLDISKDPNVENATLDEGTLIGNALNNDLSIAGPGAIYGGAGNDKLHALWPDDYPGSFLDGQTGNDTLFGSAASDTLDGGDGNDSLLGNAGFDSLTGGSGKDTLNGGDGFDDGYQDGADTLISIENPINVSGTGTVARGGTANRDLIVTGTSVRDDVSIGEFFPDLVLRLNGKTYQFTADDFDRVIINTLGGNDNVTMSQGPSGVTINLGDGSDFALVGDGGAIVNGGAGNDELHELDAVCFFNGGSGTDYFQREMGEANTLDISDMPGVENATNAYGDLIGNNLNNHLTIVTPGFSVIGNGGNDTLEAPDGATLLGGPGNDKLAVTIDQGTEKGDLLRGDAGDDTLLGSENDDTLDGGTGADLMKGGTGFDTVDYSTRTHNLTVGIGTQADDGEANEHDNVWTDIEKVIGGKGNDLLRGNSANNVLLGLAGNDTLYGGGGNDALFGGSGNDHLFGEAGNDFLDGQSGADTLDGGAGTDKSPRDPADHDISIEILT